MKEFMIKNLKNLNLNILEGIHIKTPKALLIHVHGIGSHFQEVYKCEDSLEYKDRLFKSSDIKSFAVELHGHGKSEGLRCSIDRFDDLVDDMYCLIIYLKNNGFSNLPIFIIAESMGGAVAIRYNIKYQFETQIKGYILLSPLCGIDDRLKPNPVIISILMCLSHYIPTYKALNTTNKMKTEFHNMEYLELKDACKFSYHDKMRLNTARECYYISLWINDYGHLFNAPLFLLHGLSDTITNPEQSIKFYNTVPNKIKDIYLPKDKDHSLLIKENEYDKHPYIILNKIHYWINKLLID
jgi:acylglycerol lipase|uniref:Serine aminopeptidase S33 domain-containing protein n=1 Tax=viral metagenome TaxID=1070528 RepID=A0A6C0IUY1_9ZZZZ